MYHILKPFIDLRIKWITVISLSIFTRYFSFINFSHIKRLRIFSMVLNVFNGLVLLCFSVSSFLLVILGLSSFFFSISSFLSSFFFSISTYFLFNIIFFLVILDLSSFFLVILGLSSFFLVILGLSYTFTLLSNFRILALHFFRSFNKISYNKLSLLLS